MNTMCYHNFKQTVVFKYETMNKDLDDKIWKNLDFHSGQFDLLKAMHKKEDFHSLN